MIKLDVCLLLGLIDAVPLVGSGSFIPETGTYGGIVIAGWHEAHLEKITISNIAIPQSNVSSFLQYTFDKTYNPTLVFLHSGFNPYSTGSALRWQNMETV